MIRLPAPSPRSAPALLALAAAAIGVVALAGCGGDDAAKTPAPGRSPAAPAPPAPTLPLAAPAPAVAGPLPVFVDVGPEAGITPMNHTGKPLQKDWIVSGMGGGTITLDYDDDGDIDICVVDGTMLTAEGELEYTDDARTRLFRNDGGMKFTEVTQEAGIDIRAFGFGGASCDYDADGHTDFYVCCWGRNFLMRNRGDGTFEDVTAKAGLLGAEWDMSTACAWGDVNGDGVQDVYVVNYLDQWTVINDFRAEGRPGRSAEWRGFKVYVGPPGLPGQVDRLYLGNGDGTFREVTETNLGPQEPERFGFQSVMTDVDNDGDLDIYVANDTQSNYLWINDGKGVFVDRGVEAGVAMDRDCKEQAGMGVDAADVNRDGWIDLFVTNFSHDYNTIYLNQSGRTGGQRVAFLDSTHQLDVARPSYLRLSWGTRLFDYDNDSHLDLFVACGHVYGEIDHFQQQTGSSYRQRCLLLHNQGPPLYKFRDTTDEGGPALALERVWRGATFGDFDDDGDMDVFVTSLNDRAAMFRNDGGNRNAWIGFHLEGKGGLRDPSGARVVLHMPDGRRLLEELHNGAAFCSDNDPRLFFGLGQVTRVPRVEVLWPGGERQTFEDVEGRAVYRLKQGSPELRKRP